MDRSLALSMGSTLLLVCVGVGCGQHSHPSPASSAKSASLPSGEVSVSITRKVEVSDPVYHMTAYTLDIPAGWKYAGTIARDSGCHATGASLKYTTQTADGLTAIVQMPGVAWSWSTNPQMQQIMAKGNCPGVDIDTAAGLLVNIIVPNLRPNGKLVEVLPLRPEGQAALADQLAKEREQNAAMARQYGQRPQKLILEGARARVLSERDGKPVEEMISTVIECNESQLGGLMGQPASTRRGCSSRGEVIVRAPKGKLDALLAQPQFQALSKTIQANPDWAQRLNHDQQAAFQQTQASSNAQFQQMMQNSEAQHQQLLANGRAFQANMQANTQRALAIDRAHQAAMDESAHKTAMYSLDQQEFRNPNTGQVIQASNQYNHQWISSDGSTLIQTNDHTYDPNGQVYPVSQSWSELVPK